MRKISPGFKWFLCFFVLLNGLNGLRSSVQSLSYTEVYRKDFASGYLLAKALIHGVDPYLPLSELAVRFNLNSPTPIFPHPTPHTIAQGVLMVPFSLLPYEKAAVAWWCFELFCLAAALLLLFRGVEQPAAWGMFGLCFVGLLGWWPITTDLLFGQMNLVLLLCLTGAWLCLRADQDKRGGALLGAAIALKMMGWPIVIFLFWQRRWRAFFSASGVFLGAQLVALYLVGRSGLTDYYLHKAPAVTKIYDHFYSNYSVWSLCLRWFEGTRQSIYPSLIAPPLLDFGSHARWLAAAGVLLVLLAGWYQARQARSFDTAFSLLLCASLLVNPIAWDHYMLLTLIPLTITLRQSWEKKTQINWTILSALLIALPSPVYRSVAVLFQTAVLPGGHVTIPWAASLFTSLPTLLLLGWLWWLRRSEQPVAVREDNRLDALAPQAIS